MPLFDQEFLVFTLGTGIGCPLQFLYRMTDFDGDGNQSRYSALRLAPAGTELDRWRDGCAVCSFGRDEKSMTNLSGRICKAEYRANRFGA